MEVGRAWTAAVAAIYASFGSNDEAHRLMRGLDGSVAGPKGEPGACLRRNGGHRDRLQAPSRGLRRLRPGPGARTPGALVRPVAR